MSFIFSLMPSLFVIAFHYCKILANSITRWISAFIQSKNQGEKDQEAQPGMIELTSATELGNVAFVKPVETLHQKLVKAMSSNEPK